MAQNRKKQPGDDGDFFAEFMSFKSDWDKEVKARGTEISTEAGTSAAAKTKKKAAVTSKPKTNHFVPPSGTARLTEKNLKKMELLEGGAAPQAPAATAAKFSKDSRFKAREIDERQLLYPKIDFARQTYHASKTAIRPKVGKKRLDTDMESVTDASTAATSVIGDKPNVPKREQNKGIVINQVCALSDRQLERMLRIQFRRNANLFTNEVVITEVKYDVVEKNIRGTKMTSQTNMSKLRIENEWQERRGPTMMSYAPKEDITKADIPAISFPKGDKGEKSPRGDYRRPLDPNLDAIRKVPPQVSIAPEHEPVTSEMIKEHLETKGGPATYDPSFRLTEARTDVGITKFRDNYFEKVEEEDTQPALEPNFNFTKPNKLVFKYFQPTEQRPQHAPDKELNPGKWVFYDVDLDAVRAELATNVYMGAKDENREEFAEREEFQRLLEEHIKRLRKRMPEHGDYEKPFAEYEIEGANVDFSKQVGREEPKELDDMDELEGDILILDPDKLKKRLPNINFERQLGREEAQLDEMDDKEGDVLDLEPMKPGKRLAEINFDKQVGREEPLDLDDDEVFIHDLPEDPIPKDPSAPKAVAHDFGRGGDRFDHEKDRLNQDLDLGDDEVFLDPQPLEKKIKGTIYMDKGEERFKERANPDPFYDDQPINEIDNDVHAALDKAIKPQVAVPDFKRYTNGGKEKKIKDVVEEEEKKEKTKADNTTKSKTQYGVKNIFKGSSKKKKVAAKKKPKEAFESAQDEVERYLKELGLQ